MLNYQLLLSQILTREGPCVEWQKPVSYSMSEIYYMFYKNPYPDDNLMVRDYYSHSTEEETDPQKC